MRGQAACGGGEREKGERGEREEGERGEREEGERGEREREGGRKERLATHRSGCNLYPVFLFWVLGGFQQLRGETDFWQKRRREGRDAGNKGWSEESPLRETLQHKHNHRKCACSVPQTQQGVPGIACTHCGQLAGTWNGSYFTQ